MHVPLRLRSALRHLLGAGRFTTFEEVVMVMRIWSLTDWMFQTKRSDPSSHPPSSSVDFHKVEGSHDPGPK